MKVYIVTDGEYSDYQIMKVFSNRVAAEEYKYWHHFENDIEEYEVVDTAINNEGQRCMYIKVSGIAYPEAVVNIKYEIYPKTITDTMLRRDVHVDAYNYKYKGILNIWNWHYVPVENWDEEKYKEKYTKALYDQAAFIKYMLADGASIDDVIKAIRNQEDEE